jgi:diaminohydroxyphosphoribosylaminopyrimidine deaminase/5-amino-6-(5-phosphoribosylamino)uracil reductase
MALALQLARRGLYSTRPNPRVGCVIVSNSEVVGASWHERAGEPHAEVRALEQAGERARGATCYVTLEPCSHHGRTAPCTEVLLGAGVRRVVAAMVDPNPRVAGAGIARLRESGVNVQSELLAIEAEALNIGFCQRMRAGRPWLRAKVGMSLDGRIAMASGESKWITGDASRHDVQHWRARSCAVMTGVGTVLADDPSLTVRDPDVLPWISAQPLRVVVDSELRTPHDAKVLQQPGQTLVLTTSDGAQGGRTLRLDTAEVIACSAKPGRVDLHEALRELALREVNEVLVEAGSTLTGALLQAQLVDELICYMAPTLLGDQTLPLARLPGIDRLGDAMRMQLTDVRQLGPDLRLILRPQRTA